MQSVESGKVQIGAVKDVEGARRKAQFVQEVHVMDRAGREKDHGRQVAVEVKQGMQFDSGFVAAELGPREKRQAQVDGGGVQRIGGLAEFGAKGFVGVEDPWPG